jgi:hypothetical protein
MALRTTRRTVLSGLAAMAVAPLVPARAFAAGWTRHDFPPRAGTAEQRVNGIFAASLTAAWSIGVDGVEPVIGRWDGSTWRPVQAPAVGGDIAGTAADDVWIGTGAKNMHWDGVSWTVRAVPAPPAGEMYIDTGNLVTDARGTAWSTTATTTVLGTGPLNYRVMRWDGTAWQLLPNPPRTTAGFDVLDLDVTGATGAWVVGTRVGTDRTLVVQWDGSAWVDHQLPGDSVYPEAVLALGPSAVWVSGQDANSAGFLARWNGESWSRLDIPGGGRVSRLYDVGNGGPLVRTQNNDYYRWGAAGWQVVPTPPIRVLYSEVRSAFAAAPDGGIWAAGSRVAGGRVVPATALYL